MRKGGRGERGVVRGREGKHEVMSVLMVASAKALLDHMTIT